MDETENRYTFVCNICGGYTDTICNGGTREELLCQTCFSNARFRAVTYAFQKYVLKNDMPPESFRLCDMEERKDLKGIGQSDWPGYAFHLERRTNYTNTFYHQEPRLDITGDVSAWSEMDFVISSDVLEHVEPPISTSFMNLRKILRPGGVLILSVPYQDGEQSVEYYPDLYKYKIIELDSDYLLINKTRNNEIQVFGNLVFHGGPGSTLEMRMLGRGGLIRYLQSSGFTNIVDIEPNLHEIGAVWPGPHHVFACW